MHLSATQEGSGSIQANAVTASTHTLPPPDAASHVTRHAKGDFVLRMYPPDATGRNGAPHKLGSFWQGSLKVIETYEGTNYEDVYLVEHLVTGKQSRVHVTQLKPFVYDPTVTIPLNIAARDKDEYVVGEIIEHGRNDEGTYIWRVRWDG